MKSKVQIFTNAQFGQIRTSVTESGEPLFCLADVCKAVELSNPSSVRSRLDREDVQLVDLHALNATEGTNPGNTMANFITEGGFYDVILYSNSAKVRPFRKWVTSEVLPSIRKKGGYIAARPDETPDVIMARALLLAKDTIDRQKAMLDKAEARNAKLQSRNDKQQETIKLLQPGATFAKAVETSEHSILVGELAHILRQNGVQIGQKRLFDWMRDKGYLCKKGEMYNQPTQKALDMALSETKKTIIQKPSGQTLVATTTKVTGQGQVYFVNKFLA